MPKTNSYSFRESAAMESALSTQRTLVAAKPGYRINVRRIRGTVTGSDWQLYSGSGTGTPIGPKQEAGSFDTPGLDYTTESGDALTAEDVGGTVTANHLIVEYAYILDDEPKYATQ